MSNQELLQKISELEKQIANLPIGSVTQKNVNGKEYYYHRYTENGKRKEKYIDFENVEALRKQIAERKDLEKELKKLRSKLEIPTKQILEDELNFRTNVRTGSALKPFAKQVEKFKKRECFSSLHNFVYGDIQDRVFVLYGLRRTGKTTMLRQLLNEMSDGELSKSAFIQISPKDTLADVNKDMALLQKSGFKFVLIDEVTLMADFIEGAALFSDLYATCGMKIVLSGTDSLGFMLSQSEQLYDRCILLHTTFISYREFENVLGLKGIDEYIRFGGTMSLGGINYNNDFVFANKDKTSDYVDSAIARNIQHSLKYYQDGGHFRHLIDLYDKNELTSAINRVVEDINHRFTKEVLTKEFISNDLALSARNLRRDRTNPSDVLDRIDIETFTQNLKKALDILDKNDQSVKVDDIHATEIKEYLQLLDLIFSIDKLSLPNVGVPESITVISQPGMRYAQAEALVNNLLLDNVFEELSLQERNWHTDRILSEIKGRMMEDIILLETKLAFPNKHVFKLQFAIGEFDMVICDVPNATCEIFEIKYSTEAVKEQCKHLIDEHKCKDTEFRFGIIKGKYVIYRGETKDIDNIHYVNVEEYLKKL